MMERKSLNTRLTAAGNRLEELARKSSGLPAEQNREVTKILEELGTVLQELRRVNDELRLREDSAERRSSFPQMNPNPVVEVDLTGHIYYQNPAAEKLFPDLRTAGPSHPWIAGLEKLGEVFNQDKKLSYVREIKVDDLWFQQFCYFVLEGKRLRIYGLDITEKKETEEELRKTSRRLKGIMESISDGFFALDKDLTVTYFSTHASRLLGRSKGDVVGKKLFDAFPEAKGSVFDERYTSALRENKFTFFETYFGVKPFENWYDVRVYPFEDGISVFFQVTTERKLAEQALIESERKIRRHRDELEIRVQERTSELQRATELLERIFSSIGVLIAYMDKDFNFIRVNRAYAESDERTPEFYPGKNHFVLFPNAENEAIFRKVVETVEPHFTYQKPFEYPEHPERGITYWDWSLHPVKEEGKGISGVVLTLVNVTERVLAQEKLRRNEELLRTTMDLLPVGLWVTDKEGQIIQGNLAGLRIWAGAKYAGIEQFGEYRAWRADSGKRIEPDEWAVARAIRKGETSIDEELEIECFDGTHKIILNSAVPIRSDQQEITGAVVVNQDITDRKETEKHIQSTNTLLGLFSKTSNRKEYLEKTVDLLQEWTGCRCVGIRVLDDRGFLPYESYTGFSREFWESENWLSLDKDVCACARVVKGEPEPQDLPYLTPAGSFCCNHTTRLVDSLTQEQMARFRGVCIKSGFLSVAIIPIRYRDRPLGAIHLADEREALVPPKVVDFIEFMASLIGEAMNRFNLEEGLRQSEARLRRLSSQLITVQENERKRIAREIHDGIGQSLSAIKFRIEGILQQKGRPREKDKSLEDLVPLIRGCIDESRRVQMDLRPSMIDDLGILPTINWFCREFEKTYTGLQVEKHFSVQEQEVPDLLKIVIFRMLQEAMNNIAKHSKATLVDLYLEKANDVVEMIIQDNGAGFDPHDVRSRSSLERGMGLESMRERAELSGGTFAIDSFQGKGTTIRATWPLI
jgi:PAS domain S-box-containing protein